MTFTKSLTLAFFFAVFASMTASFVIAATVSGTVSDSKTKEPIIGATIKIGSTGKGARSGLDGSYSIKNVTEGKITVSVTYTGYLQFDTTLDVNADIVLNIPLSYRTVRAGELTVLGKSENGSEEESQKREQNADQVISSVSARTIEVSPDLSVANVSQRVSGVSMTRTANGDAQYAIIRGMDRRYNYTTINDIKIPAPDNKNRYVPLDIFPAELLDRLEVTKSLLPSMEGDAIGGAMNLVMKQAPERQIASLQLGTGYNAIFGSQKFYSFTPNMAESPRMVGNNNAQASDFPNSSWTPKQMGFTPNEYASATYGNRFFDDQSLGVIIAGSLQNTYRGANTIFFAGGVDQTAGAPHLDEYQNRTYSTLQSRTGGMANIDYRANESNTFQLFGLYTSLLKREVRDEQDTDNTHGGWPTNPDILHNIRFTNETQNIGNVTLSGADMIFGRSLEADWHLAYSDASLSSPDEAHLSLDHGVNNSNDHTQDSKRLWTYSDDKDKSLYLNLKTTIGDDSKPTEFTYGGMYRNKTRSSKYDEYDLAVYHSPQFFNGNIALDSFYVIGTTGTASNPLNYDAHENITAGFAQAKFSLGNILAIGGIRAENTDFGWTSAQPISLPGKTGSVNYTDLLPSLSLKYSTSPDQNWRLSYFRSISRPSFYEIIPNSGISGDDYTEVSNYKINRTTADNIDVRWEFFPGGLDQLLVGAFYKRIQNPIEWVVEFIGTNTQFGPENLGNAANYGFELNFRKFFSNFGVSGNYTFTNSQITTGKVQYTNAHVDTVQQTRPLEGQSEHIGNLSLLYKDFESGTNAQISAVYTGTAIVGVSAYLNDDVWEKGFLQLDFSAEQRLLGNLAVYLKVTNILNAAREEVIHQPYNDSQYNGNHINYQVNGQDVLIRREYYDRQFILGFRFKM